SRIAGVICIGNGADKDLIVWAFFKGNKVLPYLVAGVTCCSGSHACRSFGKAAHQKKFFSQNGIGNFKIILIFYFMYRDDALVRSCFLSDDFLIRFYLLWFFIFCRSGRFLYGSGIGFGLYGIFFLRRRKGYQRE